MTQAIEFIKANRAQILIVLAAVIMAVASHTSCDIAAIVHGVLDALGFHTPLSCPAEVINALP